MAERVGEIIIGNRKIAEMRVGELLAQPSETGEYLSSVAPETALGELGFVGSYTWNAIRTVLSIPGVFNRFDTTEQLKEMDERLETKMLEEAWLRGDRQTVENILSGSVHFM